MTWDNSHGKHLSKKEIKTISEIKLFNKSHSTAMKLSQLKRQSDKLRIITFSLPKIDYIVNIFEKRPNNIQLVCHSNFEGRAIQIKERYPEIEIKKRSDIHSKIILIEPKTVYLGSANFGESSWVESEIGLRSKLIHDWYVSDYFDPLWNSSIEVKV